MPIPLTVKNLADSLRDPRLKESDLLVKTTVGNLFVERDKARIGLVDLVNGSIDMYDMYGKEG